MKIFLTALLVLGSASANAELFFEERVDLFECQVARSLTWTFTYGASELQPRAAIYSQKFLDRTRTEAYAFSSDADFEEGQNVSTLTAWAEGDGSMVAEFSTTARGENQTPVYSAVVTITNSKGVVETYKLATCRKLY